MRAATVWDEEGNLCSTLVPQQQRWRRHFTNILNIQSQFDETELRKARQRPLHPHMADPPSAKELKKVIEKMKNGKIGGSSGILPEMVQAASCESEFLDVLLDLVDEVWKNKVPQNGQMLCWFQYQRRESSLGVINGGVSSVGCRGEGGCESIYYKRGYKNWLRMSYLNHSVVSRRDGAVWI